MVRVKTGVGDVEQLLQRREIMSKFFQRILVPLDGSAFAERVLAVLPRIATPAATELVLVNVIEPVRYAFGAIDFTTPRLVTYIRTSAQAYIEQQADRLRNAGYQVKTYILDGDVAQCILDRARAVNSDLIAMTTHGRSGFVRWALGSVAERVVQGATVPVLLVGETQDGAGAGLRHILVPLDGSTLAEQALPLAQTLASATGAHLLLLQVVQAPDEGSKRILWGSVAEADAVLARWCADAEHYLRQRANELQETGVTAEVRAVLGNPDKVIHNLVADEAIDLIVMSTHGRSGLSRWYYGSVANKVMRSVGCPLLLVRSKSEA
jgi:nucleotide-binding universal stress UspA family protein